MPSKDSGLHAHYHCLETTIDALPALSKNPQKGELTDCKLIVQAQPTRGAAVGLCYILYHLRPSHQGGIERDCRCAARSHGYSISVDLEETDILLRERGQSIPGHVERFPAVSEQLLALKKFFVLDVVAGS
ncbi:hypothetical protein T4B_9146 [Trichinella pseudospiralis]|uniref:Uncharacterized protein n=1 Tax=Trichinella pseudospiralis TaxID=6337 RepID=A0A0V1JH29_TRIPS|nr:hypothetical protein T4B_9146 [Trichinella pseudospiralis]KRZ40517.1 hypothetical protein T4C_13289 [Trichinella pseudospiralis]